MNFYFHFMVDETKIKRGRWPNNLLLALKCRFMLWRINSGVQNHSHYGQLYFCLKKKTKCYSNPEVQAFEWSAWCHWINSADSSKISCQSHWASALLHCVVSKIRRGVKTRNLSLPPGECGSCWRQRRIRSYFSVLTIDAEYRSPIWLFLTDFSPLVSGIKPQRWTKPTKKRKDL